VSHIDQHQDQIVCDRVVYLRTEVDHLDQSGSVFRKHHQQAEGRLMNAAVLYCDRKQHTMVEGVSFTDHLLNFLKLKSSAVTEKLRETSLRIKPQ